jgi:hypothetical protein
MFFLFLEAKEDIEVIGARDFFMSVEVTEVFRTTQILEINNLMARITLC